MSEQANAVSKERATQDVEDIKSLQGATAFNRYFLRRLKQKQATWEDRFRNTEGLTHEEREVARKIVKEYDAILSMMALDERAAHSTLTG